MANNTLINLLRGGTGFGAQDQVAAQDIGFRQQMAQALLQQGMQQPQGQMVGNHYVAPSWTQYLANGLSTYAGSSMLKDNRSRIAELLQQKDDRTRQAFLGQNGGAPAIQSLPGRTPEQSLMAFHLLGPEKYAQMAYQQQKPISVAPGGTLVDPITMQPRFSAAQNGIQTNYGPDGAPRATPVQGYGDLQAKIEAQKAGAVAGAQAQYDLVSVPDGRGGTIMMPRSQAAQVLGGSSTAAPQQSPSASPQGGLGMTPSAASQAATTRLNDNWVTNSYQPALDNAGAARNLVSTIQAMRTIPLDTGAWTEARGAAASLLSSLGVKDAANLATDVQKFQSLAMDRLQTELMKQKGPQTEGDSERASQTFAKLSNTPEANKFILDFAQAKANMDMRKAEFYEAALPIARRNGDLTEVDRRWRKLQGSIWDDPILAPYKGQ